MSLTNPWRRLQDLLAGPSLQTGVVESVEAGVASVRLPGGGLVTARGETQAGAHVFVRGPVIEGPAPALDVVYLEI